MHWVFGCIRNSKQHSSTRKFASFLTNLNHQETIESGIPIWFVPCPKTILQAHTGSFGRWSAHKGKEIALQIDPVLNTRRQRTSLFLVMSRNNRRELPLRTRLVTLHRNGTCWQAAGACLGGSISQKREPRPSRDPHFHCVFWNSERMEFLWVP
jgi:hypothetical protein